jgi:predicted Rossmann fold flavoprotein
MKKVIVVGGGAAGFFGAIACAEAYPHIQVTLLEAGRELLSKVRISGGGRCNVTHACFEPALLVQHYPRGGKELRGALSRFQPKDTIAWFQKHGVALKTEADGRMFPTTDDSSTIINCFLAAARQAGVQIKMQAIVQSITRTEERFEVTLKSGETLGCDRILLATGSNPQGYRLAAALGHAIIPPVPSLFTFNIPDPQLRSLAGVAIHPIQMQLDLPHRSKLEQTGACLFTHWGLSGPAVLKLSAWGARVLHEAHYQAPLLVNWLPGSSVEQLRDKLVHMKAELSKRAIATTSPFGFPRRFWEYLVQRAEIPLDLQWAQLSKVSTNKLLQILSRDRYLIQGKGVFKDEFVTCGGVNLKEVDFSTMQSKTCPGLFLAGEILDIDGVTGGFNFQSAWTTGWLAGHAIVRLDLPP